MPDDAIRKKYGAYYYDHMCPDKTRYLNKREVLDFDLLRRWLSIQLGRGTIKADTELHISGGEPLLRPDIEDQIEKLLTVGLKMTIFTNGLLISKRPRLLSMPLKWVVAHHMPNSLEEWRTNAILIADKPHMACRVIHHGKTFENRNDLAALYDGLNFHWIKSKGLRLIPWEPNTEDFGHIPTQVLHLIVPNGSVFPCNVATGYTIGNLNDGTYWPEKATSHNQHCRHCVTSDACPAYQSAVLCHKLNNC